MTAVLHPCAAQGPQRRQDVVEKPVMVMVRHLVELGDVGPAHCARRLRIVREPRGLQPATHQLQAEGFTLRLLPVADRQPAILDREVVLGDAVGLTQDDRIGVDALLARRGRQPLPAGRVQLDQGVIKVKRDEIDRSVRGNKSHGGEGSTE